MVLYTIPMKTVDKLGILIPSRGQVFTRVMNRLVKEYYPMPHRFYFTDRIATPEAFNILVDKALRHNCNYLLFIEEDTVPPKNFIQSMLDVLNTNSLCSAVAIEYPLLGGWSSIVHLKDTGDILYCGMGCTLMRADTFKSLTKPYFRSDLAFYLNENLWKRVNAQQQYGLYDVLLFSRLRKLGFQICQIPGICEHLMVDIPAKTQENGSTITIKNKADTIRRSELPTDISLYWKEEYAT